MKRVFALLLAAFMLTALLCACNNKKDEATPDEATATVTETTVVLETTADGGTIEQDSEGNKITKDKDGKVIAVEDKDGNPIDVDEYLQTHSWVEGSGSSGSSSGSGSSGGSEGSGSSKEESSGSGESSDGGEDLTEGEIPIVIATIPVDTDDLEVLPDL